MSREIKIVGTASRKVSPDTVKVYMYLMTEASTATLAQSIYNKKIELIDNILKQLGYNPEELVTEHFIVDKNIVYEDNKKVNKGYKAEATFSIVFDLDYNKLEELIANMSQALGMRITYDTYLKEADEVNQQVLNDAVQDACNKAGMVASACGVEVGEMLAIMYEDRPSFVGFRAVSDSHLKPSEVTVSKTIEITWELK